MEAARTIRLTVPGTLQFRRVAVRAIREVCALVGPRPPRRRGDDNSFDALDESMHLSDEFDVNVVSAFSEIFNNIALHAYADDAGDVDISVALGPDRIVITITDRGASFDISAVPPPDALPEHGMGIHLARLMLDELSYEPGPPNVWRLIKARADTEARGDAAASDTR